MFGLLGSIYLNFINMIALLLVIILMIENTMRLTGLKNSKAFVITTMVVFIVTSTLANVASVLVVDFGINIMGDLKTSVTDANNAKYGQLHKIISNLVSNILPSNFFGALIKNNMLASMIYSVVFGYFITKFKSKKSFSTIASLVILIKDSMESMIKIVVFSTPVCMFSMICAQIAMLNNLEIFLHVKNFILVFLTGYFY
ncbi:hypothetical protein MHBO_000430 [Bonamia ostreae]|uniref:Amino acid transporter n=1 Tax=Bonamia ostreae TaxID=126728 RepID=A0ABV2AFJ5_9EUKA